MENEDEFDVEDYQLPEESRGFSISDVIGDKLKTLLNNNKTIEYTKDRRIQ